MVLNVGPVTRPIGGRSALVLEQAAAALRAGATADAERTLRAHLLGSPFDTEALAKLAEIVLYQGRAREAVLLLRQVVTAAPEHHDARLRLARLLYEQGEPHQAHDQLVLLPQDLRSTFDVQTFEALLLGILGRHQPEIAIYEKLVAKHRDHPPLWTSFGNALKYAGRSAEAVRALRKAVKLRPSFGEGWWSLANLKTVQFDARDIAAMRRALSDELTHEDALHLHFALGKALEDCKLYRDSFAHYQAGNRIRAGVLHPGQMYATAFVDEAIATFDPELMARAGSVGDPATDPIFIVGLQRSGSTLVEQILASHPLIEGTSELLLMQRLWLETLSAAQSAGRSMRDHLHGLSAAALADLGADYLERARPFRQTDKPRFVDKLPANWMHIGFIRLVLPNAKIVDARRHPMACGFSNFKQHYATGVAFAYSQDSIGRFYGDYLRLMRHFDAVQRDAIHLVINERLIQDVEGEVRQLLDFVGVPFDEACIAFHRNARSVNTPSAEQVRRPINSDGVDYWRHYEPWLGPLKQALGTAFDDWDQRALPAA